jgi:hypothetical protein
MKTQFTIEGTVSLPNGTIALTGSITGSRLSTGQRAALATSSGAVEVEILSIGVGDPNLEKQDMQMVLGRVLRGDYRLLKGATLNFD